MKIRFTFNPVEVDIPNSDFFDYFQDLSGYFDVWGDKDVTEKDLSVSVLC